MEVLHCSFRQHDQESYNLSNLTDADDFVLCYNSQRYGLPSILLRADEHQNKMCSLHRVYAYSLPTADTVHVKQVAVWRSG